MVCDHANQLRRKATAQKEYVWLWVQVSCILNKAMRRCPDIKFNEEIVRHFGLKSPSTILWWFHRRSQLYCSEFIWIFWKSSWCKQGKSPILLPEIIDSTLDWFIYGNINFSDWGILSGYNIHQINVLIGKIIFHFTLYQDLLCWYIFD